MQIHIHTLMFYINISFQFTQHLFHDKYDSYILKATLWYGIPLCDTMRERLRLDLLC